jgi:glycosidase
VGAKGQETLVPQIFPTPTSVRGPEVGGVVTAAKAHSLETPPHTIDVAGRAIRTPFPSPEDWRDTWIYFLLVDRFNNPVAQPAGPDPRLPYQGGTFAGIKAQLRYIKNLGAGAIWLSPVLMNPQRFGDYYGGYAIQDFLRIEPRFCSDPQAARDDPAVADAEFLDLVNAIHAEGMYVVLDIVLNHAGDLFNYEGMRDSAPWNQSGPYQVFWRDSQNVAQGAWTAVETIQNLPRDAGVWPTELQQNRFFRRRGDVETSPSVTQGDFGRLKELVTDLQDPDGLYPVRDALIRAHQYLVAKFDLDGFRVDTLMYVERDFARTFANACREFALSIGKKNFFTFGEVWKDDDEEKIAEYVGRDTRIDEAGIIGFDAALDFPLRKRIEGVCKGVLAPSELANSMDRRLSAQRTVLSSHGDVGAYFVTFLENHDLSYRYAAGCKPEQVTLALTCLFTLQGVPCLYYGMEQGHNAAGTNREFARACLWRAPSVFTRNPQHPFYEATVALSKLRQTHPALRYGRQYFRPITGDDQQFGYSPYAPGVLAYSRILNDTEVLVVANSSQTEVATVRVVVDRNLNRSARTPQVLHSNLLAAGLTAPGETRFVAGRAVVPVTLRPMEAQVIG